MLSGYVSVYLLVFIELYSSLTHVGLKLMPCKYFVPAFVLDPSKILQF